MLGAGAFTENFRSALNGFNRTDVVQFIQRQSVEHEKAMRLLREENARLKQVSTEVNGGTEQLQAEKKQLADKIALQESQLAALMQQNSAYLQQIQSLMGEKTTLEASLAESQKALEAAIAAKDAAEAAKEAAETAKEATAEPVVNTLDRPMASPVNLAGTPTSFEDMELAAYRRAELAERMARERAAASSERIQNIFAQADEKITLTATDMNQLLESFRSNFDQMQSILESARNILAESSDSLRASAELSSVV